MLWGLKQWKLGILECPVIHGKSQNFRDFLLSSSSVLALYILYVFLSWCRHPSQSFRMAAAKWWSCAAPSWPWIVTVLGGMEKGFQHPFYLPSTSAPLMQLPTAVITEVFTVWNRSISLGAEKYLGLWSKGQTFLPMQAAADTSLLIPVFKLLRYQTYTSPQNMFNLNTSKEACCKAASISWNIEVH